MLFSMFDYNNNHLRGEISIGKLPGLAMQTQAIVIVYPNHIRIMRLFDLLTKGAEMEDCIRKASLVLGRSWFWEMAEGPWVSRAGSN